MATKEDFTGGMDEMDFSMVDNGFGLELPISKPATYTFQGETEKDVDALAYALADHDFTLHDVQHDEKEDGTFYCYGRVLTDHYKDVKVRVWNKKARVYPLDEEEPDRWEFVRIVKSIEEAFGAELEHTPEERSDNGGEHEQ